jgi:dihydroorotase
MKVVFKDVKIVNPAQGLNETSSILIEDGIIKKIGEISKEDSKDAQVFEFEGKVCSPGFFDMHVHLREPGRENAETIQTGCNSAAAGGFTGVASMPNTNPCSDNAETISSIIEKSKSHLVDVHPIGAVTVGRKGEELAPLAELFDAGAKAFSDDGVSVKTAQILRTAMEYSKMFNTSIIEHCEDASMAGGVMNESFVSTQLGLPNIPTIAEDLIVMRDIILAEYLDANVHIAHISSKEAVELVRQAKKRNVKVTAEVTPHHFTLTDESIKTYDTNYKMNPPLREQEDVDAMIEGLKDGTIDCIASDHAPHPSEEKEREFIYAPNGIIGLETEIGLALSELYHKKHLSLEQIVEKFAVNPRKVLNLEIPEIKEGSKANLTVFDPDEIWTVDISKFKSKSRNTPFDKRLLTGKAVATVNKSKMFYNNEFINL